MSWNGDTRTKTWRFYEIAESGHRSFLGESIRDGFETLLEVDRVKIGSVQAEALDAEGTVLVDTSAVRPEILIQEYKGKVKKPKKEEEQGGGLVEWLMFKGQKIFSSEEL